MIDPVEMPPAHSGRPVPQYGQIGEILVDYVIWDRQARADGRIDDNEAQGAVPILQRLAVVSGEMAMTQEHIATVVSGSRGMFSPRARRGWTEKQKRRNNIIELFPSDPA